MKGLKVNKAKSLEEITQMFNEFKGDLNSIGIDSVENLKKGYKHIWTARLNEKLVGYSIGRDMNRKKTVLESSWTYVKPGYRDKDVGTKIAQQKISYAKRSGFDQIYFCTMDKDCIKMFEKQMEKYDTRVDPFQDGYRIWVKLN